MHGAANLFSNQVHGSHFVRAWYFTSQKTAFASVFDITYLAVVGLVKSQGVRERRENGGVRVGPVQVRVFELCLLSDCVHLGEENGGEEDPRNGHDRNGSRRVVEGHRSKVVHDRPGHKYGDHEHCGASYPPENIKALSLDYFTFL